MTDVILAPCVECSKETLHQVAHIIAVGDSRKYETLQCRGCNKVSLKETKRRAGGKQTEVYYPAFLRYKRSRPSWTGILSLCFTGAEEADKLDDLVLETYSAVEHNLLKLAVMGIRSVLEHIMVLKIEDKGFFSKNLSAFAEAGYISVKQYDALQTILDAGHAVTHRSFQPDQDDVDTALGVMEGVIESIYAHDDGIRKLAEKIPERKRSPKRDDSDPK
jgi:hypothetical protein